MFPGHRSRLALAAVLLTAGTAACGGGPATPSSGTAAVTVGTPTAELGSLPAVDGFLFQEGFDAVPGFLRGVEASLGGEIEAEIVESGVATRGNDSVIIIAFGFPRTGDEVSIDSMGRILDGMEDSLQAPAARGLDGRAYVIDAEGQSVVMAPWARTDYLVLLFLSGPTEATHDLARGILGANGS